MSALCVTCLGADWAVSSEGADPLRVGCALQIPLSLGLWPFPPRPMFRGTVNNKNKSLLGYPDR